MDPCNHRTAQIVQPVEQINLTSIKSSNYFVVIVRLVTTETSQKPPIKNVIHKTRFVKNDPFTHPLLCQHQKIVAQTNRAIILKYTKPWRVRRQGAWSNQPSGCLEGGRGGVIRGETNWPLLMTAPAARSKILSHHGNYISVSVSI